MQSPPMEKHPAESVSPLLNVEVAPEVRSIDPPEIVKPPVAASSAAVLNPAEKVEVADEVAVKIPPMWKSPATVEEAWDMNPPREDKLVTFNVSEILRVLREGESV